MPVSRQPGDVQQVVGTVELTDQEFVGFEREEVPVHADKVFALRRVGPQKLMRLKAGAGGEVRFEMDLDVTLHPFVDNPKHSRDWRDVAVISGEVRLYEGTSESTTNLRERAPIGDWRVHRREEPGIDNVQKVFRGEIELDPKDSLSDGASWSLAVSNSHAG